jgi:hypothetical protein
MGDWRRAMGDGLSGRRSPFLPLALFPFLLVVGCGGLGLNFGGVEASTGAHSVFLAREGCATFVARTLGHGFLLATVADGPYAPAVGDVLEGPLREGPSVFTLFPPGAADAGSRAATPAALVPLDVAAVGLPLADARAHLDAACGPPRPAAGR